MLRGRIADAGLDVTTVDPIPRESPLWDLPNTIITSDEIRVTRYAFPSIRLGWGGHEIAGRCFVGVLIDYSDKIV